MHAGDGVLLGARRFAAFERYVLQRIEHCLQATGMLGVTARRLVAKH